jgi:hypothetical protein
MEGGYAGGTPEIALRLWPVVLTATICIFFLKFFEIASM